MHNFAILNIKQDKRATIVGGVSENLTELCREYHIYLAQSLFGVGRLSDGEGSEIGPVKVAHGKAFIRIEDTNLVLG